jgi:hypothetical protein
VCRCIHVCWTFEHFVPIEGERSEGKSNGDIVGVLVGIKCWGGMSRLNEGDANTAMVRCTYVCCSDSSHVD